MIIINKEGNCHLLSLIFSLFELTLMNFPKLNKIQNSSAIQHG